MVYLYAPESPDSDKRGLWEICSIASPRFFNACPAESRLVNGSILRGYQAFFEMACKMRSPFGGPCLDAKIVSRYIPDAMAWRRGHDNALKRKRDDEARTEIQKKHEKLVPFLRDLSEYEALKKRKAGQKISRVPYWRRHHGQLVPHSLLAGAGA
jgi:hypothetical protein